MEPSHRPSGAYTFFNLTICLHWMLYWHVQGKQLTCFSLKSKALADKFLNLSN